ncbi:MAG TPA: response regulator [Gemmatimonadaceae bacterium]|nr:response regulator [Gemmatimonadaceae bacterium]
MRRLAPQPPSRSVLWVDDEAESLEPHRLFLREKGYEVHSATNAEDAVEMLRRQPFDLLLLDEQMPGKRGLEAYREVRELAPSLPVVMVTKSEEDTTLREALGVDIRDYIVKPVTPRQVLTVVTRVLDGPKIRQQAMARKFVDRFRELELERQERTLDWRGWIDRFCEMMRWDIDLASAGEMGLYDSLRGLYPDMHREFAAYMLKAYPEWLRNLDGDRPPLSIDVVEEFVLPVLKRGRNVVFVVVDCMRLDQWCAIEPLLSPLFDVETTHYFAVLPTATPYSRNALFSGLFPGEIAARLPDWWGEREDETLNAHERELLELQLAELDVQAPVRYEKISSAGDSDDLERHLASAIAQDGVSAFVFNFVDLLTHGRSESAILYEVARDEIGLRRLTRQWFERSALFSLLKEAARRKVPVIITSDHGSIHCETPATVFAKRDATANLRYKFGEDLRAERPEHALLFPNEDLLRLPRRGPGGNTLLAAGDSFFVYPTKLREYQSRYRGSFLHGGVTPEECILPLALLTPRR